VRNIINLSGYTERDLHNHLLMLLIFIVN